MQCEYCDTKGHTKEVGYPPDFEVQKERRKISTCVNHADISLLDGYPQATSHQAEPTNLSNA